jgi:abortive infection bacteriophage resistance protein
MKYTKPPLTFDQQADLLIRRGLVVSDRKALLVHLSNVSYYRLSAYWYPFRQQDDTLKPGTAFEKIWRRYTFDCQLRLLVMDAIERVEIAVRTQFTNKFTLKYGAFGHLDPCNLPNIGEERWADLIQKIRDETVHSQERFVEHYREKYKKETDLPLWMTVELMTFGMLFTFFRGTETEIKRNVAAVYGISAEVLDSWLHCLNQVRNICAHHGRLWNRVLGIKPAIPRRNKHPQWHTPIEVGNERLFAVLTLLRYLIAHVAPLSRWPNRVERLLEDYSDIPLRPMGFPEDWQNCPIWKNIIHPVT